MLSEIIMGSTLIFGFLFYGIMLITCSLSVSDKTFLSKEETINRNKEISFGIKISLILLVLLILSASVPFILRQYNM